jgi:acetyltransferase-like isoleucine patch superfamily enzyme
VSRPVGTLVRHALGRGSALVALAASRGAIRGESFRFSRPGRIRVSRGGRIEVGRGVVIEADARITVQGAVLRLEPDVFIGKNATITAFSDVTIGAGTLIAENVSIHSENHGRSGDRAAYSSAPVTIGPDSWLGAGVVVTAGVAIGAGATIGANAVVTKDVPAGATAVGVPAKVRVGSENQR